MITAYFLIDAAGWTWIIVIAVLLVGGYFFIDRLMRKGIYEGRAGGGMMGRMGSAQSELQTLVDPAHRHVIEEQGRKRAEHDDAETIRTRIEFPICDTSHPLCTIPPL